MYKTIKNNISYIFMIAMGTLMFAEDSEFTSYHYQINDESGIIDEIRVDFEQLGIDEISRGNSLYIYFDDQAASSLAVIKWDKANLNLNKMNTHIFKEITETTIQNQISNVYERVTIDDNPYEAVKIHENVYNDFGGSAASKINKQIKIHSLNASDDLIIELPLLENINSEDILRIYNIPIIFTPGHLIHADLKIGYFLNSTILEDIGKELSLSDFEVTINNINTKIIKSDIHTNLSKEYKFNDSNLPLPINFELYKNDASDFSKERFFRFKLDDGLYWEDDFFDLIVIANNKKLDKELFDIYLYDSFLIFEVKQNIPASKILFKKVKIKTNGMNSSKIYVSTNFDRTGIEKKKKLFRKRKESANSRYEKKYLQISSSERYINIHDIDFWLYSSKEAPFVVMNNKESDHQIPILNIKQNDKQFIQEGMGVNLVIPDKIDLKWGENIESNNPKYSFIKDNDKNIKVVLNQALSLSDTLKIDGLRFKNNGKNIPLFNLQTQLLGFDNSNAIYCNNQISIGQISAGINKSQIIFTSQSKPSLQLLEIFSDSISSILQPNDILWLDISNSKELSFNLDQKIKTNYPNKISFSIDKKKLHMKLLEPIPDKIIIEDILFDNPKKSEQRFNVELGVDPGNFQKYRKKTILTLEGTFMIYDIDVNLLNNIEYVKNVDSEETVYVLPDIIISNNSPFSFSKIDQISIELPDAIYSYVDDENTKIISSKKKDKLPTYKISNNELYISLNGAFDTMEKIQIKGMKIKLDLEQPSFISRPIQMNLKTKQQDIIVNSSKKITYGSPTLKSRDVQLIFEKQNDIEYAYQMKIDFSEIPNLSRRIDDILLRIPNNIDLSWNAFKDALIEVRGVDELYKSKVTIENNKKDIIISLENIPKTERGFISIGDLAFSNAGLVSDEFKLKLSIDNGKSFCALDNKKQIISESNSVVVMQKIIKEKWYPYKKGNSIDFIILDDAPFEWDIENFNDIYLKGKLDEYKGNINPKSQMFELPILSENKKRVSFKIKSDIISDKIKGAEQMDFGKKLWMQLKVKKTNNDIALYRNKPFVNIQIESIFGKQILKGKQGGVTNNLTFYETPKYKHETDNVLLKIELQNDMNLGDPVQIRWYRDPTYLLKLFGNKDETASLEKMEKTLKIGFQELEKFYKKDFDQRFVKQDWTFWYYLSLYKYNWNALMGDNIQYPIIEELASTRKSVDIEKAKKFGYNPSSEIFHDPRVDETPDCKLFFEDMMSNFNNDEYNKTYNVLYEQIYIKKQILGCEGYEILSRYLLALLSSCLFDDNQAVDDQYTFAEFQLNEIKELIKYGDNLSNLEEMVSNDPKLNEMFLFDPIRIDENCSIFNYNKFHESSEYGYNDLSSTDQFSTFVIKWHDEKEANDNEWEVSFTDMDALGEKVFLIGHLNANYMDFGEETSIYGNKTYRLDFDPQDKEKSGTWLLGLTGALTLMFLSF